MSSESILKAYPAKFPNYKCFVCHEVIAVGSPQVWDKTKPKGNQNCHEPCYNKGSQPTPQILQKNSEAGTSKVIDEVLDYCETHMELANEIRISVAQLAKDKGYFEDATDKKMILGYTAHDIIMAKLTPDVVGARIGEKTKKSSVEIDEVANSSQVLVRGASRTFHTSSAIKDEVELWQQQSLENFAQPLFFLIRNKRFVPKCEIHGTVCNEETFACKKCVDNADDQKRKQDLFNSSSMIDTSLLL